MVTETFSDNVPRELHSVLKVMGSEIYSI